MYLNKKKGEVEFTFVRSRSKFQDKTSWNADLVDFLYGLQEEISGVLDQYSLPIFTCHKRGAQIFRGHPNYRGLGKWNDWVWVKWGGEGRLPSHIWCFVVVKGLDSRHRRLKYGGITVSDGTYAVVEVAQLEENHTELGRSTIMTPFLKEVDLDEAGTATKRYFYLADTEAFVEPCCCVPDIGGEPNRYFAVRSRTKWADDFTAWLRDPHNIDDMDPLDADDKVVVQSSSDEEME